jgi:DNA replication and repair protein RecF
MIIEALTVSHFRNLRSANLALSDNVNVFYGDNGQGKTSILEAIYMLGFSRSFRENSDSVLAQHGQSDFRILGSFSDGKNRFSVEIRYQDSQKKLFLNSDAIPRMSSYLGTVPVVVLTPDAVRVVSGPPLEQRAFADALLAQVYPGYLEALLKVRQCLRQKAEILHSHTQLPERENMVKAWNEVLARYAAIVTEKRAHLQTWLNERLSDSYAEIAGTEEVILTLHYEPSLGVDVEQNIDRLATYLKRELQAGKNLLGPQRDRFHFALNSYALRQASSQGERKTAVIALKILEAEYLGTYHRSSPIILFDDIFAELDRHRVANLLERLQAIGQTFITSTYLWREAEQGVSVETFRVAAGKVEGH